MSDLRLQTVSIFVIVASAIGVVFGVDKLANQRVTPQIQVPLSKGIQSANPNDFHCKNAPKNGPCVLTVNVTPQNDDPILCDISVADYKGNGNDVVYAYVPGQPIQWQLSTATTATFRFESISGVHQGIEIKRNEINNDFSPVILDKPQGTATTSLIATPTQTNADFYTIYVEQYIHNVWERCGKLDPVIVNRD